MNKRRAAALLLLFCALLLAVTGCLQAQEKQRKYVFGYSTPSLQNSFWISVTDAMQQTADEMGVELAVRDATSDTAKQTADIEDLIEQQVDVLLVTPYDSMTLAPAIRQANKAGIPVIIVDIGINDPDIEFATLIITDNYIGGEIAGKWLADYIEVNGIENATVATIEAQQGAQNARERREGFIAVMNENGIEVVAGRSANSLRDEAMMVMEDFLQTYPNLTAVFAECDDMALGALKAIEQAKADTIVVGYDGNFAACEQIKEGTNLLADVDQQPGEMGKLAVIMAIDLMEGKAIEKEVKIIPTLIDGQNVDEVINAYNAKGRAE